MCLGAVLSGVFVLVNLKAYSGEPVPVAEAAREVSEATGVRIAVAPQTAHLERVAATGVETWAQHVSSVEPGSHTGATLAESVAEAGATGTLLNHSERRLTLADLDTAVGAARDADLETVVCANTPAQVAATAALGPDAAAIEPPELIGTGTPVSRADPEVVTEAVEAAGAIEESGPIEGSVPVLCGAGISTGEDLVAARDLGATGVLLASGVAKADDPAAALSALVGPIT
jgi:triosephosphate isomerase